MVTDHRHATKSGQAAVEFCIGVVAMLVVIGGAFQLGRLGLARTDARVEATRVATSRSMLPEAFLTTDLTNYLQGMREGPDGSKYSLDDEPNTGNANEAYVTLLEPNHPEILQGYASGNDLAGIEDTYTLMTSMGLVQGGGMELNIPVLPVMRRLFFQHDTVDIQMSVWMVRTGDLY